VPDDATDEQVLEVVRKLVGSADDLYRAGGGNGLKVTGMEITADEPAPVPTGGGR
jgi:hypothetical protein